jgi:hypothetical protein
VSSEPSPVADVSVLSESGKSTLTASSWRRSSTLLRWLLGKATATLEEIRLAEFAPKEVYAWRLTIPEGHRFEATQALRQC